ncbi:hypothetical protein Tco_0424935 [Tanacetum coccineum]
MGISLQIQNAIDHLLPSKVDASVSKLYGLSHPSSFPAQTKTLYVPMKFKNLQEHKTTSVDLLSLAQENPEDPHDDAHSEGRDSARGRRQLSKKLMCLESHRLDKSMKRNKMMMYLPTKHVSHKILWKKYHLTMDEAKLKKMADEMLRQRCTSGDEHSRIYWIRNRKEVLGLMNNRIVTSTVSSTIIFNDDDIEECTSRWVNKCVKKFNPYARYGVEHWKNPHAKIDTRKQKEPGKPKEEVYSNSKIIQVIKTYWELGHEHKFVIEIVARRANECIVSITGPDYKNLNKNDIEDMYLLIMNSNVPDYAETGLLWSLSVFIRSSVIWERVHDFQLGIESYQQNINLTAPTMSFPGVEKHRIVLEGLKSYNNDVKYGYVQRELTNDEVEYLKLFEEEIEAS